MDEEYFDGPSMGNDDDDWLYSAPVEHDDVQLASAAGSSVSPVNNNLPDSRIKVNVKYAFPGLDEVLMLELDESLDGLMKRGEARLRAADGGDVFANFFLKDGDDYHSVYAGTCLKSYELKNKEIDFHVEYSFRAKEPDFDVFAEQKEAEAARSERSMPSDWAIVKLQGNVHFFSTRKDVTTAYVVVKSSSTFKFIGSAIQERFSFAVRFKFDGDFVGSDETLKGLDIEDFDCVDCVKV